MIEQDQRWYFLQRATASRALASAAISADIASIHMELHRRYLEKADEASARLRKAQAVSGSNPPVA